MKNFGEKGAWAYPGSSQIFCLLPIISGTGKAKNFKFGMYIHRVYANKTPLKIWKKNERGRLQRLPIFSVPLLPWERAEYELQIWQVYSQRPSEQKHLKNLREKGAWAYPGTVEFFSVRPIISGMGKAMNFKFCTHILSIDRNKARDKFWEK